MEISALIVDTESGFVDLSLRMHAISPDTENGYRFEARALYEGHPIAFAVALGTAWQAQEVEGSSSKFLLRWGAVELISLGAESDAFIQTLDQLYQTKTGSIHMRRSVHFAAVSLEGDPSRLPAEPLKMKLFFESNEDDLCAEVYLNFDILERNVQFHEKDKDFRRPLVLALREN
jgi:hypothetical protein